MIVFIAGMPRSGSTFSFNIVRCLLEARGTVYQESTESILGALQRAGDAPHLLVKAHGADDVMVGLTKLGAVKAVCTVRKPEDAIASWMTTFGFTLEESVSALETWLRMFNVIRDYALIVPFEQLDREPETAARKIARYIYHDADDAAVDEIAIKFTKPKVKELSRQVEARNGDIQDLAFSFYDKTTFFHRRHVLSVDTLNAAERIGRRQIASIRQALAPWCDAEGNLR